MNILIAVAPPMHSDILDEFLGRSVTGIWSNPSGLAIVDIKCSTDEYNELKLRPGVTIYGAWDNGAKVEAHVNLSDLHPDVVVDRGEGPIVVPRGINDVHKWFGDPDKES